MRITLLLGAVVACSGGGKPTAQPDPPATSLLDCTKVADHVATTVAASGPRTGATPGAVKDMVVTRCKIDAWSDETKQCLHAIKTVQEGRACATGMTEEQRTAIKAHARSLRADASGSAADDQSADWVKHVVEE